MSKAPEKKPALALGVNRVYRAKRPANCRGMVNDRQIIWMDARSVQYDSPAVGRGQRYKTISIEEFLKWAGQEVTEPLPYADWLPWPPKIQGSFAIILAALMLCGCASQPKPHWKQPDPLAWKMHSESMMPRMHAYGGTVFPWRVVPWGVP